MTDLADWDNELAVITKDLETLKTAHGKRKLTGAKALVARKVSIIQLTVQVERNLERLRRLVEREVLLLPREKALVHGARLYLERSQTFLKQRSDLLARGLWLKLIKTRLLGAGDRPGDAATADDLIALAVRQESLGKTERYLAETLVKLRQRRRDLIARYEALGVAEANRTASQTLRGRLGQSPDEALASPPMRALASYVKTATAPVSAPEADARVKDLGLKLGEKTDGLLQACRSLIVARLKDPGARPGGRTFDRFESTMQQLDELADETRRAYDQMVGQAPATARPILVQKPKKGAKTVPFAR